MVKSSAAWGRAKQDDKGEALLALLWAERDTRQKDGPFAAGKNEPQRAEASDGFQ